MIRYIIYKLIFPNDKIYIGQTRQEFNVRMNQYKNDSLNNKKKIYNILVYKAIRKYGWENVEKEIICTVSEGFVDEAEIYFIKEYRSNNKRFGYNIWKKV